MDADSHIEGREHLFRWRAQSLQPLVPADGKVLEYFPRDGLNLASIRARTRIAVSDREISALPAQVQVTAALGFERELDLIICDHVLESLSDPLTPLEQFKSALKPGGKLLVLALYDPAFRHPDRIDSGVHFYSWNVQTLGNLLVDTGYEFQSGQVEKRLDEKRLLDWAPKIGWLPATFLARFFTHERQVRVVGSRSLAS